MSSIPKAGDHMSDVHTNGGYEAHDGTVRTASGQTTGGWNGPLTNNGGTVSDEPK